MDAKAAALLHPLARNHSLADGNKRLALAAVIAFYGMNGHRLMLSNDAARKLVMQVAAGQLDSVNDIAAILKTATEPSSLTRPAPAASCPAAQAAGEPTRRPGSVPPAEGGPAAIHLGLPLPAAGAVPGFLSSQRHEVF